MNTHLYFVVVLVLVCSCQKNDEMIPQANENLVLEFSASPIPFNGIEANFSNDISYGADPLNVFDIFLPQSATPTPLVVFIHGGGFTGGEKSVAYTVISNGTWDIPSDIRTFLSHHIAFATINYQLLDPVSDPEGVIKCLNDGKRCLQYIRSISDLLNVDKNRIVLIGNSGGGGMALWLGFSDDMADSNHNDLVMHESTRVKGLAVKSTQASYDFMRLETDILTDYNFNLDQTLEAFPDFESKFLSFYAIDSLSQFYTEPTITYRENIDMLGLMSSDDPEFWVYNRMSATEPINTNIIIHHPYHARSLKEWGDSLGLSNVVSYADYANTSGESFTDFVIRKATE